jgi:predicted amidohydrolase YtcJ
MKSGAIVAAGSDWSVSTMNPVDAMEVAVTRCGPERMSRTPFIPDERVDLYDIIASYTISGAYANHEEQSNGSLEVGKEADFIVLDRNLFQLPASEIHKAKVLWTFLHGKPVFKRDGAPALAGGLVK